MHLRKIVICLSFLSFHFSFSQDFCPTEVFGSGGNVLLSVQTGQIQHDAFDSQIFVGMNLRWMMSDHVSLNYNLNFGKGYFHSSLFGLGGNPDNLAWLNTDDDALCVLFLMLLLPEGISFHIPINEKATLSPFINFKGSEMYSSGVYGDALREVPRGYYGIGSFLDFNINGLILSPFIEYGGFYNVNVRNIRFGGAVGFLL